MYIASVVDTKRLKHHGAPSLNHQPEPNNIYPMPIDLVSPLNEDHELHQDPQVTSAVTDGPLPKLLQLGGDEFIRCFIDDIPRLRPR
ncbi:hypothetical protein N7536_001794 [Penicillium majusculum]|nr:hypothetical protein N7536_001794 [Penicillium majusculum]